MIQTLLEPPCTLNQDFLGVLFVAFHVSLPAASLASRYPFNLKLLIFKVDKLFIGIIFVIGLLLQLAAIYTSSFM